MFIFPVVILALVFLGLKGLVAARKKEGNRVGVTALVAGLISVSAVPLMFLASYIFPRTVWLHIWELVVIGGFVVAPAAIALGIFAWRSKPATGATAVASGVMGLVLSYMCALVAAGAAT